MVVVLCVGVKIVIPSELEANVFDGHELQRRDEAGGHALDVVLVESALQDLEVEVEAVANLLVADDHRDARRRGSVRRGSHR